MKVLLYILYLTFLIKREINQKENQYARDVKRPLHVGVLVIIHRYKCKEKPEFAVVHKNEKTFKKGE